MISPTTLSRSISTPPYLLRNPRTNSPISSPKFPSLFTESSSKLRNSASVTRSSRLEFRYEAVSARNFRVRVSNEAQFVPLRGDDGGVIGEPSFIEFITSERVKVVAMVALALALCNADRVVMSVAIVPMSLSRGWRQSFAGVVQVVLLLFLIFFFSFSSFGGLLIM